MIAGSQDVSQLHNTYNSNQLRIRLVEAGSLTFRAEVIILEVVLAEPIVLAHAELYSLHHLLSISELVVCDVELLQVLGDADALEHSNNAFLFQQVARQVDLFERRLRVYEDLEDGLGSLLRDPTVGQGEQAQNRVHSEALRQSDHTVCAKIVMIEFQNLDLRLIGLHLRVQRLAEEFTTERGNVVVKELEELDGIGGLEELADGSHALILAVGLPESDRSAVLILRVAKRVHDCTGAWPSKLLPDMELCRYLLLLLEEFLFVLNRLARCHIILRVLLLVHLEEKFNSLLNILFTFGRALLSLSFSTAFLLASHLVVTSNLIQK